MKTFLALLIALVGCASFIRAVSAQEEWRSFGGDVGGQRFSRARQLNRANVGRVARAWTYHTGETSKGESKLAFQCTPIVVDGVLYFSTPRNRVVALDAETGAQLWAYDPKLVVRERNDMLRSRSVAYWEGLTARGRKAKRILFGTMDGRLLALDAETGRPCSDFGADGTVDLTRAAAEGYPTARFGMTSPPAIYRNLVIVGARLPDVQTQGPSGDVRAYDVRTGKLAWRFHTVPRLGDKVVLLNSNSFWRGVVLASNTTLGHDLDRRQAQPAAC